MPAAASRGIGVLGDVMAILHLAVSPVLFLCLVLRERCGRRDRCQGLADVQRQCPWLALQRGGNRPGQGGRRRAGRKWRFPAKGANFEIGVIHATPVVVSGYVYFGTVNKPAFYKLTPDGKVKWSFRLNEKDDRVAFEAGFHNGIYNSALVTDDAVYFATLAGFVYALDRDTGKEKWRLDMREKTFPELIPERDVCRSHPGRRQSHRRGRRPRTGDQVFSPRLRRFHRSRFRHGPGATIGPHRLEV